MTELTLLVRRDDWTEEEFAQYWQDVHGPIARAVTQIRRYVQSECLDEIVRGDVQSMSDVAVDGVAEVWYDSREAMAFARESRKGRRCWRTGRSASVAPGP